MSREFPLAGSVYSYVQRGLNSRAGFLAGWMILADYLLLPALLYGLMATWAHALIPGVPTFAFVVVFVGFNTLVTARGVTVSDRTNFVVLMVELATLALFAVFTVKLVFVDGGGTSGSRSHPSTSQGGWTRAF